MRIRDRFGTWEAETEDLGPRGCRIVTARLQTVGTLVSLTLESDLVGSPLEVTGQVVWTRAQRPVRAGISFAGGASAPGAVAPAAWYEAVAAAACGPEIVIEVEGPVADPAPLVERLRQRGAQLLGGGDRGAAELILRRALALAPGDAALAAALHDLSGR